MNKLILSLILIIPLSACRPKEETITSVSPQSTLIPEKKVIGGYAALPKASVFKMTGDYADNVAVTFDSTGKLIYFPAPTDLSNASSPLSLGGGWYLNRQGCGENSVFTKWTFEEYMNMSSAPTPAEIKEAVIPGASVIDFKLLPLDMDKALADPEKCLIYLN